jgi:hypothetical protein
MSWTSRQELLEQLWNAAQQGDVEKLRTCVQTAKAVATWSVGGLLVRAAGTAANSAEKPGMCDLARFLCDALRVAAVNDWPDAVELLAHSLWVELQNVEWLYRPDVAWLDVLMASTWAGSERAVRVLLQSESFNRISTKGRNNTAVGRAALSRVFVDLLAGRFMARHSQCVGHVQTMHTALIAASICGHVGIVRQFVQDVWDHELDQTDGNDRDALGHAVYGGHVDVARVLLDAKARLCRREARPALLSAIQGGFGNAVQVLLDAKAAVNQGPIHPLKYAYEQGRADVVQLLLDANADVHNTTHLASSDDSDSGNDTGNDGEW